MSQSKESSEATIGKTEHREREREGEGEERYIVLNGNICPMLREELEDRHMAIKCGKECGRPSALHDGSQGKRNAERG